MTVSVGTKTSILASRSWICKASFDSLQTQLANRRNRNLCRQASTAALRRAARAGRNIDAF